MKINIQKISRVLREKVGNNHLYSPSDIVNLGVIVNTLGETSMFTIYRLIKSGKLRAIDLSTGSKPQYRIRGSELKKYVKNTYSLK